MKTKYIIILLFSVAIFSAQKKIMKISYQYNYLTDSTNKLSEKEDLMILAIKDNKSYFYSEFKQIGDSLLEDDVKNGIDLANALKIKEKYGLSKNSYFITKDYQSSLLLFSDKIMNNSYSYFEQIPTIPWKILKKDEQILGYQTIQATAHFAGRDYIAWFTTEIPVFDGPYKFQGLPGLILKLTDTKNNFLFKAIAIEKNKYINTNSKMGKVIPTTKEKYAELKKNSVTNFIQFINSTSEVMVSPVNTSEKPKEKPYNPIELN
ncbi:GLPGLI family protein [Chryseobacterium sp. MP_3.2]|uniref:GLPGLI family protein n=1 Tax=Chryseobacterium sp. MP_3.2 TaxID=3071712 RepID=UPI002E015EE9|nr:GLPGLI family protein [Chryseobacterium sp. MP_3.2]